MSKKKRDRYIYSNERLSLLCKNDQLPRLGALLRPGVAAGLRQDAGRHPAVTPAWIYQKRPGLPLV